MSSASTGLHLGVLLMTGRAEDYERTMAFADIALGQMKALRQVATRAITKSGTPTRPAYHPALNQQVNAILKAKGTISEADLRKSTKTTSRLHG